MFARYEQVFQFSVYGIFWDWKGPSTSLAPPPPHHDPKGSLLISRRGTYNIAARAFHPSLTHPLQLRDVCVPPSIHSTSLYTTDFSGSSFTSDFGTTLCWKAIGIISFKSFAVKRCTDFPCATQLLHGKKELWQTIFINLPFQKNSLRAFPLQFDRRFLRKLKIWREFLR